MENETSFELQATFSSCGSCLTAHVILKYDHVIPHHAAVCLRDEGTHDVLLSRSRSFYRQENRLKSKISAVLRRLSEPHVSHPYHNTQRALRPPGGL